LFSTIVAVLFTATVKILASYS